MKIFLATATLFLAAEVAKAGTIDTMDPHAHLTEEEFAKVYNHEPITDPAELQRREEALAAAEAEEAKVNAAYLAGEATWVDKINEFSDLPADEMDDHTGRVEYAMGRIDPNPEDKYDEESERYFDQFRYSRAAVPASYSSVAKGYVTPVRSQGNCGSCVAFSTAVTVETCFKKVTGAFGDYSEQHMVDCAYDYEYANACNGAATHSYTQWLGVKKIKLASEGAYPYKGVKGTCPAKVKPYNQGAAVTGAYKTYEGTEELMKKVVYEHGAVVGSVVAKGPFQKYSKGIFAGCPAGNGAPLLDHCIAVVGYGTEGGVDYWLIKNSWGKSWGENGYIRLKRGVKMCGIGSEIATVTCGKVAGPTDAPPVTTPKPCKDSWSDCGMLKSMGWCPAIGNECPKSCGKC